MVVDLKTECRDYWDREGLITPYFDDINAFSLLSEEEEVRLLDTVRNGSNDESRAARNKLVESNLRFVVSVARRWQNSNNIMDLINEGNIGLMYAIDNYRSEKSKGRFIWYAAWWIRKYICDYVVYKDRSVTPPNANKVFTYLPRVKNDFFAKNERYPTLDEMKDILREKYGVMVKNKEDFMPLLMTSLDEGFNDGEDSTPNLDYEAATSRCDIEDEHDMEEQSELVRRLLSTLTEKERKVVMDYFGIGTDFPKKIKGISEEMDLTKERVRQIVCTSIDKIRRCGKEIFNDER
ncbi:MAG: sigma-70 family RNA polymerase sigma factor [Paludibacteraceae bacterium]|nr:sigma-70 family RNA polymerase sigma factor [Paludibacteraceae bacterium]